MSSTVPFHFRFLHLPGSFYSELFSSLALAPGAYRSEGLKVFFDPREERAGLPTHGEKKAAVTAVKYAKIIHDIRITLPLVGGVGIPDYVTGKRNGDLVLRGEVKPLIPGKAVPGNGKDISRPVHMA